MDLADRLIERLENDSRVLDNKVDNLGLPIPPTITVDYICARVLKQHPKIYKYRGRLYDDHVAIKEDKRTLVSYNGAKDSFIDTDNTILVWDRIRALAPELSFDKIEISDHLLWDMKKGELEWRDTT